VFRNNDWYFWGFFTTMSVLTLVCLGEWLGGDLPIYAPLFGIGGILLLFWIRRFSRDRWGL
jgi:hypothetical protein